MAFNCLIRGALPAMAVAFASVLLLGLSLASSGAPAAATCKVLLKGTPERPYANTSVTIKATASNCDRITRIDADQSLAGKRRYPCPRGSACTIRVTAPKAQVVRFTAQATKNGNAVKSNTIVVRWIKSKPGPGKFTMTIKNAAGKVVWKSVQDLATGKTTTPIGADGPRGLFFMPARSTVTVSAYWDAPIARGGEVLVKKEVWDSASGASRFVTACKTSTPGETGCSRKLTLNDLDHDHGHDVQMFQSQGRTASVGKGWGGFVNAWVYLTTAKP